jgi:hypothetical protein
MSQGALNVGRKTADIKKLWIFVNICFASQNLVLNAVLTPVRQKRERGKSIHRS